jgi:23S rRNA pseudouridine955/2504/2580 synthase
LLGDDKYSDDRAESFARQIRLKRLFLHAASLRFSLPEAAEINLQAPLGLILEDVLQSIRK